MERIKAGDSLISDYFERTMRELDRFVYPDIPVGMRKLLEDRNVIRVAENGLKGFLRANPFHSQNLHIFGHEKPYYPSLIFTKRSPLTRIFWPAVQRLRESGTIDQLRNIWEGKYMRQDGGLDAMILSPGQVIAAYAIIVVALVSSSVALLLEILWKKLVKGRTEEKLDTNNVLLEAGKLFQVSGSRTKDRTKLFQRFPTSRLRKIFCPK